MTAVSDHPQPFRLAFTIEPNVRSEGLAGEQATLIFLDPSGHALEAEPPAGPRQLFARQ
jgi:uncharacterized protein